MEQEPGNQSEGQPIWEKPEIQAPPNYVSVFHVAPSELLPEINEQGLVNYPRPLGYEHKEIFDQFRPDRFKEHGLSRFNLYASLKPKRWSSLGTTIEVKVDPERCYVGSAETAGSANEAMSSADADWKGGTEYWRGRAKEWAEIYWSEVMPLSTFLANYTVLPKPEGSDPVDWPEEEYERNPDAPPELPQYVSDPEILIPDPVPPRFLRVGKRRA